MRAAMKGILVACALALVSVPRGALAQDASRAQPYLSVRGEGKVRAKPDVARLPVVLSTRAATLDEASRNHASRVAEVGELLAALKDRGVTVRESRFTVRMDRQPVPYHDRQAQPEPVGVATTRYDVEVRPPDRVDAAVSELAAQGDVEVGEVSYGVDDAKGQLDLARKAAMADAMDQAALYAREGGFRLKGIVAVQDGSANVVERPRMQMMMAARAPGGPAPSVGAEAPGTIDTEASVNVTWRILDPKALDLDVPPR